LRTVFRCLSVAAIFATLLIAAWPILWANCWPHLGYFPGLFGVRGFSPPVLANLETSWYYFAALAAFTLWMLGITGGLSWSLRRQNRAVCVMFLACALSDVAYGWYCVALQFTGNWYSMFHASGIGDLPPKLFEYNYAFWLTCLWIIGVTSVLFARIKWPERNLLILTFAAAVVLLLVSLAETVYLTNSNYALGGGFGISICLYFGTYSVALHAMLAVTSTGFVLAFLDRKGEAALRGFEAIVSSNV